ncbi:MAG: type III-B CRISPR-associated protein Cas10/Cmr2 [Acinetobacter sp.]
MTNNNDLFWQTKLMARIHDPAEKALILMNTLEGHEGGTVKILKDQLFSAEQVQQLNAIVQKADHFAAGADRPSLPKSGQWNINFLDAPTTIIHPLSGERFSVDGLGSTDLNKLKSDSQNHFSQLIVKNVDGSIDYKKSYLNNWRFGAEGKLVDGDGGALWSQLPAETRIPDHTIWAHLDLTSAFAGCFVDDDSPVLFSMQFGPVQDFIAQARSTSDLWAGSHLLSRLTWEGIKVLVNELGLDSVLVPQLRGVAMVDAWLYQEQGLELNLFEQIKAEWTRKNDDTNPLFAAALPNKFTALVPKSKVKNLAEKIEQHVRNWVDTLGKDMLAELLQEAKEDKTDKSLPCWQQLQEQLQGFPEVYWAAVPFDVIEQDEQGKVTFSQTKLKQIQSNFISEGNSFLDTPIWKDILSKDLVAEGHAFWQPNAGFLFPAIYELLERLTASVKQARQFKQLKQQGFRDTLTGEVEWLTTDRKQLAWTNNQRKKNAEHNEANQKTLWMRVAGKYGIKEGEHLGALGMIKRLWCTYFARDVGQLLHDQDWAARRYVISTHAMSLAPFLDELAKQQPEILGHELLGEVCAVDEKEQVILPRRILNQLNRKDADFHFKQSILKRLPVLMDDYRTEKQTSDFIKKAENALGIRPESYYAIFFMDGDNMGAWLTGGNEGEEDKFGVRYKDTFHPKLNQNWSTNAEKEFSNYLNSYRAVSPARHLAVSGALNSFALHLARYIVEECYLGKLFYAGGDDVMAMVAVKDLLPCIYSLRLAYSGVYAAKDTAQATHMLNLGQLKLGGGHAFLNHQLYRTMGHKATASVGAVVAHATAPLQHVLNEVRKMEKQAKNSINAKGESRDAFAIKVIKRAGGSVNFGGKWLLDGQAWGSVNAFNAHLDTETLEGSLTKETEHPFQLEDSRMGLILRLIDIFKDSDLSRSLAYVVQDWLPQLSPLPEQATDSQKISHVEQLHILIAYQLKQQGLGRDDEPLKQPAHVAKDLLKIAGAVWDAQGEIINCPVNIDQNLADALGVIEFLGREQRHAQVKISKKSQENVA